MDKRCQNCAKMPFCEIEPKECNKDNNWKKRPSELKLENTDGVNFDFEEVEKDV